MEIKKNEIQATFEAIKKFEKKDGREYIDLLFTDGGKLPFNEIEKIFEGKKDMLKFIKAIYDLAYRHGYLVAECLNR